MGNFYHNTGEGGISRFHLEGGGSLVWNVGTGYFGCRTEDGKFSAENFQKNATKPNVKVNHTHARSYYDTVVDKDIATLGDFRAFVGGGVNSFVSI